MNNLKRVTLTGVILCMALFSSTTAVSAATSQAWAYFEWNTFEYTYTGTGTWIEPSSMSNAAFCTDAQENADDQKGWTATEAVAEDRASWRWG